MEQGKRESTFYCAGPSTCIVAPAVEIQTFVFGVTAPCQACGNLTELVGRNESGGGVGQKLKRVKLKAGAGLQMTHQAEDGQNIFLSLYHTFLLLSAKGRGDPRTNPEPVYRWQLGGELAGVFPSRREDVA